MTNNTRSADFCADQIDVITNFAVITNVIIKRVHCNTMFGNKENKSNIKKLKKQKNKIELPAQYDPKFP